MHKNPQLALDFVVSATLVFALCFFLEPRWETNDDIAMSMVAHGYGIAAVSTPNLIFSNVVWGYLVRAIPQMHGVLGYSIATLGVLIIVGTAIFHALRKLGWGCLISLSVLTLILVRPVLFPQFTINAGLLSVGAIVCWHFYDQHESRQALLTGCFLAFCGYLVRSHEFLLILITAAPFLPWRKLAIDRTIQASALALFLAISGAAFFDYQLYQGENWQSFNEFNSARAPITDFGADVQLKKNLDIISRHGYTANDIDLIRSWFFVDSKILDSTALKSMLKELGPLPVQSNALTNGWIGIKTLAHPVLLPVFFTALFLLLALANPKLLATWALCLVAIFSLGILGRPGVLRVYIPILSLLVIAPLLTREMGHGTWGVLRQRLVQVVILLSAIFNTAALFSESRATQMVSDKIRLDLQGFPGETVVVWGGVFPFEAVYPVLKQSNAALAYKIYGLGVFTTAPFSTAYTEQKFGNGLVERLISRNGISIVANEQRFDFLSNYCKERLGGLLQELGSYHFGELYVSRRRCETPVIN